MSDPGLPETPEYQAAKSALDHWVNQCGALYLWEAEWETTRKGKIPQELRHELEDIDEEFAPPRETLKAKIEEQKAATHELLKMLPPGTVIRTDYATASVRVAVSWDGEKIERLLSDDSLTAAKLREGLRACRTEKVIATIRWQA